MNENKEKLIDAAAGLFLRQSYQGTGVAEILRATGLSKGAFYHFFPSKEDLGLAVVARQSDMIFAHWSKTLNNDAISAPERLELLLGAIGRRVAAGHFSFGCPLGTMAQEMASLSDPLRQALMDAMIRLEGLLAECIKGGQDRNEITQILPADELARCLWSSLQGALLMAKAKQSITPLEDMKRLYGGLFSSKKAA